MRTLPLILILFLGIACSDDDDPEKYTSLNGYWIVRTPDGATTVAFRIATDADNQSFIDRASLVHNGSEYNAQPIQGDIKVVSPQEIETVTLFSDQFVVRFSGLVANAAFTEMEITNASLRIDTGFREFSGIKATRR